MPLEWLPSRKSPRTSSGDLRTRVWGAGRLLVLVVALGITFGVFFLTGMRVANRARNVDVPSLTGLHLDAARQLAESAGLTLQIESRRPDATVAVDHVLTQEPSAGTVLRRQRAIRVQVSEGQQDPVVPVVVGQNERTAEMALVQLGIDSGPNAEIRTGAYAAGVVVAQDPPADQQSSRVALLINRGESGSGFVMPDVIGTAGPQVVEILRRHGFRVTVGATVPYPGLPSGIVVRQTPQAGFQIGYGDAVLLELSQ
jgi:beta-lactam-binding protein with PASTA domain